MHEGLRRGRKEEWKKITLVHFRSQVGINSLIILFYVTCFISGHIFKEDQILDPMNKISCKKTF